MKPNGLALGVLLLASVGAVSAIAAGGGHRGLDDGAGFTNEGRGMGFAGRHAGRRHGMMRLRQLDTNGDGAVTRDEFMKPRQDRFAALDKNGDGSLDASELTAQIQHKAGQRSRMMMARLDADGDGKVTKEEFEAGAWQGRRGMGGRHGGRHGWKQHRFGQSEDGAKSEQGAAAGMAGMSGASGMQGMGGAAAVDGRRGQVDRTARLAERFARMDANSDGVITASDLEARFSERLAWQSKKRMHVLDKNRDGKVTREEFEARAKQRFADMDLDSDGKISASDLPPGAAARWQRDKATP